MQTITLKVEDAFLEQIEDAMGSSYTTKSEFIREAIRDKISYIDREMAKLEAIRKSIVPKRTTPLTVEERKELFLEFEKNGSETFRKLGLDRLSDARKVR